MKLLRGSKRAVIFALAVLAVSGAAPSPTGGALAGPGFTVAVPAGWRALEAAPMAYELSGPGGQAIDLYVRPLGDTAPGDYFNYVNRNILEGAAGAWVTAGPVGEVAEGGSTELAWERPALPGCDLNHYLEIVRFESGNVYTFLLRTAAGRAGADAETARSVAGALRASAVAAPPVRESGDPGRAGVPDPNARLSASYAGGRGIEVRLPEDGLVWGVFAGGRPGADTDQLRRVEGQLGHHFDLVNTYHDFATAFPLDQLRSAASGNRVVLISWQPFVSGRGLNASSVIVPEIAAGAYDGHIREWARAAREFGQPVFIRLGNEMNGDWAPWCAWYYSLDPTLFVRAWRRAWSIFREEGADDVIWVWNPTDVSFPGEPWNEPRLYYPGDRYVDWVGLTAYNNGRFHPAGWRTFDEIYGPMYLEYRALYPTKPLMITEFSSIEEEGRDKGAWVADALRSIKKYPDIRIAVWFNVPDHGGEWDYQVDSSPGSLRAWVQGIRDPYFVDGAVRPATRPSGPPPPVPTAAQRRVV